MIDLEQSGYRQDKTTRVWARPDYQGLAYSDGDESEERLAQIIRDAVDLSVLSGELSRHCTDWPSLYHLGRARGNILRPFSHLLSGRVLEIGAGCGAISRYLGESGASVLSLEGSLRRATIAASRTRDLDNVTVVAERFDQFNPPHGFDVVTLIGVLEYASMFSQQSDAALNMLKRVKDLLEPDGVLLLAIENQLGLKYFAGAPEDHLNSPMYGIEGRYNDHDPETFGRKSLMALLEEAGFSRSQFLFPMPDYKLPNSIVTQRGFESGSFDAAALAWQNARKDPQLPGAPLFNLERAWPVIVSNGLGMELANSFLVAASSSTSSVVPPDLLAGHYNVSRKPGYCKQTLFIETDDGIEVRHEPLRAETVIDEEGAYRHVLSHVDRYRRGQALSQQFLNIASAPDWTLKDFGAFISRYLKALETLLEEQGHAASLNTLDERLPGLFIDAVPHNILLDAENHPALIDIEWDVQEGVLLGHLLIRALLLLIASAMPFCPGVMPLTRRQFIIHSLRHAGLEIPLPELEVFIEKEAEFQAFVTGIRADHFLNWEPEQIINPRAEPAQSKVLAKLYYSDEFGNFREDYALDIEVLPGHQQLQFSLKNLKTPPKRLRLDPVDRHISFSVDNLRILKAQTEIWSWDGDVASLPSVSGLMEIEKSGLSVLFVCLDDDPYLELPIDLSQLTDLRALVLRLDLVLYTDEVIARRINQNRNWAIEQESSLRTAFEPLHEQMQTLALRINELESTTYLIQQNVCDGKQHTAQTVERLLKDHAHLTNGREALIAGLENALLNQQIEKDTRIHTLNLRIRELEGSYSRRLAAPLRHSVIAARRLVQLSRHLPALVRRGGGFRKTANRAASVLQEHGLQGLLARMRWFLNDTGTGPERVEVEPAPDRRDYAAWIRQYDTLDDDDRQEIARHIGTWESPPLISVIMPVFDPPLDLLREALDSIRNQLYPHWELCIADDASSNPAVQEFLKQAELQSPKIKVIFRSTNGHISQASNSALDIAQGQFIALMDNDDLLPEHALYWVARKIIEHPDVGILYSDEDKIDRKGQRSAPYFKPDWNEFLFRSQNMISHLGVYRRDLVEHVGRFRVKFEGSQDYDLALRCSEKLSREQIIHISRVLYHWRIHAGSTAMATDEKPYAALAGVKALDEHLQRTGRAGWTELLPIGMYRVHYRLPKHNPLVSLIIPTRNAGSLVKQCIDSIQNLTHYGPYEIIVVDNSSDDSESLAYFEHLSEQPNITVLRDDGPFNYSALNNQAVRLARGELVGLINNDIEVINPEWLDEMVALALQPEVGAVGARLWFPDDRLQHGGVILGIGGIANHSHKFLPRGEHGYFGRAVLIQEFSAVTAACLVIRKSIFEQVKGLDEANLKVAFNDVDFCLRVKEAGYVNLWTPFAELYHHESATRGFEDSPQKQARFSQEVAYMHTRWPEIETDPAYNPNLTLDQLDFSLAWPPRLEE
ncbi:glycosyltransferase [Pseudomonas lijiangensis]|uniref:Glycosyltransferase n=1 Tax=Pseudomonas lijiangensis TaxID=2995658 RepID=A0ABX8HRV8_9PSED|nr:glycosyltransferase [Pseudomonas lijiangensis]MBX8502587.1 glycosyltransferase [Pseudomonas lijiangensis]MBX8507535.1 glycosyltransferase [Pseudomonas lijiangensis]QWU83334.1 glycosyltransferase [Pseudomonas lijiangensis]